MKNYLLKLLISIALVTVSHSSYAYDMVLDDFSFQYDSFLNRDNQQEKTELHKLQTSEETIEPIDNNSDANEKELVAPKKIRDLEVYSDNLQYYTEKNEFEATGNAYVYIPQENSTLYADRLVFNRDKNIIQGFGNVTIKRLNLTSTGDYIEVNLNEKNALLNNPVMEEYNIKIVAENSNFYPGKALAENGTITTKENMTFKFGATTFGAFTDPSTSLLESVHLLKEKYNSDYTIKAKVVEINSLKGNDEMLLHNADIYLKNIKVASAPKLRFIADKAQQFVETNAPEISSLKQFGFFFGPGYVFNLPKSATLKVAPVLVYGSDEFGVGGIGRFRTASNVTQLAWGSPKKAWILRGQQKFNDNLWLDYSHRGYVSEWFFGDRIPGKMVQLVYNKDYDFKDKSMKYANRFYAGYATDIGDSWGTTRFRYQGKFTHDLFSLTNTEKKFGMNIGYDIDGTATAYGNGETQAIVRGGPYVGHQYKNWASRVGYRIAGVHDHTPFMFDRYMYGKHSVYWTQALKVHKYLALAYSASLALLKDSWDNELMQENRFFVVIGPQDAKLNLGYDTVRQRSIMNFEVLVGTENTKVKFDKMVAKDPDKLGRVEETKLDKLKADLAIKFKRVFLPDEVNNNL